MQRQISQPTFLDQPPDHAMSRQRSYVVPFVDFILACAHRFATWRRQQRDIAKLEAMSDRMLADIGLSRSDIAYVVRNDGRPFDAIRGRVDGRSGRVADERRRAE